MLNLLHQSIHTSRNKQSLTAPEGAQADRTSSAQPQHPPSNANPTQAIFPRLSEPLGTRTPRTAPFAFTRCFPPYGHPSSTVSSAGPHRLTSKRPLLPWMALTRPKRASSRPSTSPHANLRDTERQRPARHSSAQLPAAPHSSSLPQPAQCLPLSSRYTHTRRGEAAIAETRARSRVTALSPYRFRCSGQSAPLPLTPSIGGPSAAPAGTCPENHF